MDQHSPDMLPAVELPQPPVAHEKPESGIPMPQAEKAGTQAVEQGLSPTAPPSASSDAVQTILAEPTTSNALHTMVAGSVAVTPAIADDIDLIEKEWVDKAKEIVEKTKNDPYQQNKEMTKMKADYLKKRYNKEIKSSED